MASSISTMVLIAFKIKRNWVFCQSNLYNTSIISEECSAEGAPLWVAHASRVLAEASPPQRTSRCNHAKSLKHPLKRVFLDKQKGWINP